MSIGSLQSNPWAMSLASQNAAESPFSAIPMPQPDATTGPVQGGFDSATPNGPGSGQASSGTSGTGSGSANPFQSLANDIQAMLIQAQSAAAGTTGSGTTTSGTTSSGTAANGATRSSGTTATSAATPEQDMASALQSLLAMLQGSKTGVTANQQTASAGTSSAAASQQTASIDPTGSAGRTEHHHHHHQDAEGSDTSVASNGSTAPFSSTPSATSSPSGATGSSASSDQMMSQILASDMTTALQSYAGTTSSSMTQSLTV